MPAERWVRETSRALRLRGLDAQVVLGGAAIHLGGRTYLVPSGGGDGYCLARPVGRVAREALPGLTRLDRGPGTYAFVTLPEQRGPWVEVAVRIGAFPDEALADVDAQERFLDRVAAEVHGEVQALGAGPDPVDAPPGAERVAAPGPYGPGRNLRELTALLRAETAAAHGGRLLLVSGPRGAGKKTVLGHALREAGLAGWRLADEAGLAPLALAEKCAGLADALAGHRGAVLVVTDGAGDVLLPRRDGTYDQAAARLAQAARQVPVVVVTSHTHLSLPEAVATYRFEEEGSEVVARVVAAHYPGGGVPGPAAAGDGAAAEPLRSLRHAAAEGARDDDGPARPSHRTLCAAVQGRIVGQDATIERVSRYLKSVERFPGAEGPGVVTVLAAGPPGVGKTQTAKEFARALGVNHVLVPCNEAVSAEFFHSRFTGSAPGYVGYGDRTLADEIRPG
ncbi:MAG: AAA family ATPase, partial [Deferrisomatales bacterium]